jgi:hypothetical protein
MPPKKSKKEQLKINGLSFHLKKTLKKSEQIPLKMSKGKENQ